ncbi:MAG: amidohydrolase family protein [Firmicutes bacterium]|nr:amidohydrolase family protein [Bacillota bacterium]
MRYAIINGIILDGTKDMSPIYDHVLLIENKKIVGIVEKNNNYSDYEIVDLNGKYIMPGLINLHVHLAGSGKPKKKPSDPVKLVKLVTMNKLTNWVGHTLVAGYAKMQLMSGTTTIRTVGGIKDYDTTIRDEIKNGKRVGPRILASNMAISVPGGHMANSLAYTATTPQEVVEYVDKIALDHPDLIKLMITGGVMDAEVVGEPGVLRMQPEIVKAACERAHELGFKVAAHVESSEGVLVALENGVDSIEHGARPTDEIIELMKEKKAFQVSTISPALPYALFDRSISNATYEQQENGKVVFNGIIDMAKTCIKNDIPVGLGTDTACPYITQYDMWRELYYYTKYCEVSNAFALYSATLLNARLAGVDSITGSIEKGKMADLIVTRKNPLEDIKALRNIEMVIMEGQIHKNSKVKKIDVVERELDKFID